MIMVSNLLFYYIFLLIFVILSVSWWSLIFLMICLYQVLNKTPQYLELDGSLEMVKQSKRQPSVFFRALRTNGIPVLVRICNVNEDPTGRLAFMRDPKYPRGEGRPVQIPICSMNVTLPLDIIADAPGELEDEDLENRMPGLLNSTSALSFFCCYFRYNDWFNSSMENGTVCFESFLSEEFLKIWTLFFCVLITSEAVVSQEFCNEQSICSSSYFMDSKHYKWRVG